MSAEPKRPGQCVATMRHDSGASVVLAPHSEYLESGQVLGVIDATRQWGPYDELATDGRNTATGVLYASAPPSDTPRKVLAVVADATVTRTELIGLDAAAERHLMDNPRALPLMAYPPPASIRVR